MDTNPNTYNDVEVKREGTRVQKSEERRYLSSWDQVFMQHLNTNRTQWATFEVGWGYGLQSKDILDGENSLNQRGKIAGVYRA